MKKYIIAAILCIIPIAAFGWGIGLIGSGGGGGAAPASYVEEHYVCEAGEAAAGAHDGSDWANCFDGFADITWDTDAADDGNVGPGDILYLRDDDGSYLELLTIGSSGTEENPITISAADGESPIIDGGDARYTIYGTERDWVIIQDLELTQGYEFGVNCYDCDNWIVQDILVHDTSSSGANNGSNIYWFGDNNLFRRIESHTTAEDHGIYLGNDSDGNIIEYFYIHDIAEDGIVINASAVTPSNNIIRYNWIEDCVNSGIEEQSGDGTIIIGNIFVSNAGAQANGVWLNYDGSLPRATNTKVYNNVFYGGHNQHIRMGIGGDYATAASIVNNIVYDNNTGDGNLVYITDANNTITTIDDNQYYSTSDYDWYYINPYTDIGDWQTAVSDEAGSAVGDPVFGTPGTDFTLGAASPCKTNGTDLGTYNLINPTFNNGSSDFGVGSTITLLNPDDTDWPKGAYVY